MTKRVEAGFFSIFTRIGAKKRKSRCLISFFLFLCLLFYQLSFGPSLPSAQANPTTIYAPASEITIINPYKGYQYDYKGNLHCHSTNSDGIDTSSVVGQWYADNSYDFYTISDHDFLTPDPSISGILWIGNTEEDTSDGSSGHMNHFNISSPITGGTDQERIDNALSQGGVTIINHPIRAGSGWDAASITALDNAIGMEVYNSKNGDDSSGIWDSVLSSGKTIWGVANDDSHTLAHRGNGYIVVNSAIAIPSEEEIINQLGSGNFYASRGFDLSISVSGTTISAQTTNGNQIRWIKKSGEIIKTTNSQNDTYSVCGEESYVRIEVLDAFGIAKAWSQPLTISVGAWYFAEGYTGEGFKQWLTLQNPGSTSANVTIQYRYRSGGGKTQSITVGANSRETIDVNSIVGSDQEVSTKIISDQPIIAERPMYFNFNGISGGHNVVR